jgi:hypothetical protein
LLATGHATFMTLPFNSTFPRNWTHWACHGVAGWRADDEDFLRQRPARKGQCDRHTAGKHFLSGCSWCPFAWCWTVDTPVLQRSCWCCSKRRSWQVALTKAPLDLLTCCLAEAAAASLGTYIRLLGCCTPGRSDHPTVAKSHAAARSFLTQDRRLCLFCQQPCISARTMQKPASQPCASSSATIRSAYS